MKINPGLPQDIGPSLMQLNRSTLPLAVKTAVTIILDSLDNDLSRIVLKLDEVELRLSRIVALLERK